MNSKALEFYVHINSIQYCHALYVHVRMCVWVCACVLDRIGRKSQRLVRAAALKLAQELLEIVKRPWTVAVVTRCQEG